MSGVRNFLPTKSDLRKCFAHLGASKLFIILTILLVPYFGILHGYIWQPEYYLNSRVRGLFPVFAWAYPPVLIFLLLREIRLQANLFDEKSNHDDQPE